ncbi:MAG: Cys-tRNA(Pro) deacylase [Treponema sp.]|jgi:Cys-tRNA(Pro)/Cys-tRNA(Cys) deacylase|nr:Cys-tRNA(Pro) deacylase [Treponema sp.]
MKKANSPKTNALRLLDAVNISYAVKEYPVDEADLSAVHAAKFLDLPPERIFKTLVLRGASGAFFVCCIPAADELDLKKTSAAAGEKSSALIPLKDLLPLTGYVRGGCSPLGMKKQFPTFIDETAELFDSIGISAGERGLQVLLAPGDLARYLGARFTDLTLKSRRVFDAF